MISFECGDVVMVYKAYSIWKEPGNEREDFTVEVQKTQGAKSACASIEEWNRRGAMKGRMNPFQFWRYDLIGVYYIK